MCSENNNKAWEPVDLFLSFLRSKESAHNMSYYNIITKGVAHFSLERRNVYKIGPAAGPGSSNNDI